jgi:hypothetical protein
MTEKKFKSYEEMTQEERDKCNREAFTWNDGDLVFYPHKQPPKIKRGLYRCVTGPLLDEAFENNSLLTEEHHARLLNSFQARRHDTSRGRE